MSLSKFILVPAFMLITSLSAFADDKVQIFEGGWQDGTKIEWICPKGTNGEVPIRFTDAEGKQYVGVLRCGQGV